MEHVFDGSSDGAEDLENDIGLAGREGLGGPLHRQLLLGIVIQVFGVRVDLDVLDDIQDDGQSRVDLGLVDLLPGGSEDDPVYQSRDQAQDKLLIGEDEIHRDTPSLSWLIRW